MSSPPSSIKVRQNNRPTVKNFALIVNGHHTDIVLTHFQNYTHLIVTQFEKIGNLYKVKTDKFENGISACEPIYTITSLLGAENIQAEVAVRYLAEKLEVKNPLLICLSLKDYNKSSLDCIIKGILEYL